MIKTDSIIKTKLHLPFTRPKLVYRPRLQEKLAQGLCGPLTLIAAPAGFGKTTLVASFLSEGGMPIAWLSLDKNDNPAGRFLAYLVAAVQEANHAVGHHAAQVVVASQQAQPEAILTSLINDIENVQAEIVLVLDDYHTINSQVIHDAMAFLLDHCPRTLHVVIVTRSDPPLPLARLRARGQMVELRAADLRFTTAEAAQFLNDIMGLNLDAEAIAHLDERTEGWIAGLQMAALSMRDCEDRLRFIENFSGTNRYVLDYLLEEVLLSQPPDIQHFLLCTSILERLTAPLCDFILEETATFRSAAVLENLESTNIFLLHLDDARIWYRYHHLFADLLRARLQQTQPHLLPQLHHQAATWLAQNGYIVDALQHLFAAQEIERAADLIERHGPACWVDGDPSVLLMADNLPFETLLARPRITLHQAWFLIIQGRIEQVLPLLKAMAQKPAEPPWVQTVATLGLAFLIPSTASEYAPFPDYVLLENIPEEELILRNAADFLYVMTLARMGHLDRAMDISVQCIEREKTRPRTSAVPSLLPFLTRGYLLQGRLHAVASLCREVLASIQANDDQFSYTTSGNIKIDLGEVLCEWNLLEEAGQYLRDGLQENELWQNIMTYGFGLVALTRVLLAQGDAAGAMQAVDAFETRMSTASRPHEFDEDYYTLRIRAQLACGDTQNPSPWVDQLLSNGDFDRHKERYLLTLARIHLAQGKYAEVESLLVGAVPPAEVGSQITRRLEFSLLLAAALAGQGRLPEAFERLEACLAMAEPEGYIRIFLDVGKPIRDLLAAYGKSASSAHHPFAQKILAAFSGTEKAIPYKAGYSGLVEALTEREWEVLSLIALGKTNREIARQLVVAPGTIKAHAASIFRKLDAANRTEAVARARQLELLS